LGETAQPAAAKAKIPEHSNLVNFLSGSVRANKFSELEVALEKSTCAVNLSAYDGVVDDTYTLNPTTVVDLHMSVDRWVYLRNPWRGNFDLTSIGWPASLNASIPAFARTPPTPVVQGEAKSLFSG
jgi:hypothetical protein